MDAIMQPSGQSPKPASILMSTSQLKPGSDNLQNSAASIPSQTKGKKRERGDQCPDPVKRAHLLKTDYSDDGLVKKENSLRSEMAKITKQGGLLDSESVEKLVQLMQSDRIDKKMDLISRSMLAGVIAATDSSDCLSRFVQLKGFPVLDEWLQDVHKGKIGDGSSSKDGDKPSVDFFFVLLCALDKLPVNLHALQTSNIGRSVNHLRSHKNLEIQKKARTLVDTWKKRVEAEMNVIDAKSGSTQTASWQSKSCLPEAHGCRNSDGSGDVALKSSVTQLSASKTASVNACQGETTKSSSSSPGPVKSASPLASAKEAQPRHTYERASDAPLSTREDKGNNSSQFHGYIQSFLGKEEARSSTAGSLMVNKTSSGGSRHCKSINDFSGPVVSCSPKDTGSNRNSPLHRNAVQEKFSESVEKAFDVPVLEGITHKLIVKISNHGQSPPQSVSGGSFEDPSTMSSRASSPVPSDRHEQSDCNPMDKCGHQTTVAPDINAESWQSNDSKYLHSGSDKGDGSPAALLEEERRRTVEDTRKAPEVSKVASSSSGNDLKSGRLDEAAFSSMNALIESCVKYSEASASTSLVDDVAMSLLASVAAGEMFKSESVSTTQSPKGSTPPVEQICAGNDAKSKPSSVGNVAQDQHQSTDITHSDEVKRAISAIGSLSKYGILLSKQPLNESSGDKNPASAMSEESLEATLDRSSDINEKSDDLIASSSSSPTTGGDGSKWDHQDKGVCYTARMDGIPYAKLKGNGLLLTEVKKSNALSSREDLKPQAGVSSLIPSTKSECKKDVSESLKPLVHVDQKCSPMADAKPSEPYVSGKDLVLKNIDDVKVREADVSCGSCCVIPCEVRVVEKETSSVSESTDQCLSGSCAAANHLKSRCSKVNVQNMVLEPCLYAENEVPSFASQDADRELQLRGRQLPNSEADKTEDSTTKADASVSAAATSNADSKVDFDLNEGIMGDDGKYGISANLATSGCLSNVHIVNPLSSSVSSISSSIPASITVAAAAAAKGSFVPPVDLLRSKGELGWKGSAATSAFRRAEPKKFLLLPVGPTNLSPSDDSVSKASCPRLDIDLNIPGERLIEDMACQDSTAEIGSASDHLSNCNDARNGTMDTAAACISGGLDLDLNIVDDANDMMQYSACSSCGLEAPAVPVKLLSLSSLFTSEIRRDFDLNTGPCVDDTGAEQSSSSQQGRGSIHSLYSQLPVNGVRPSSLEAGSFSAWFPPGSSYSSVNIPSGLPDRGSIIPTGLPHRILGPPGGKPFVPDVYPGSVLSSSPAMPFLSSAFRYQMFPFGITLPLPSATFPDGSTSYVDSTAGGRIFNPPINSQLRGSIGPVSSQYSGPCVVSQPEGLSNGVMENNHKWRRQGFDLNVGPGALDTDETLAQRQFLVANSAALAEDQRRIYPLSGGVLKRKEPQGW